MSIAANEVEEIVNGHDNAKAEDPGDLVVIRAQTFKSLQILRNLLALMMPREDEGGPKLVDLIAALVAQQRDILAGTARLQSDMNALFDRLDGRRGPETRNGLAE